MRDKLKDFNQYLDGRENIRPSKEQLREGLEKIGKFYQLGKLAPKEIPNITNNKGIVGIDGSYTVYGNTFPYIIFLGQALAKYTSDRNGDVKETYLETGLTYIENGGMEGKENADSFIPEQINKIVGLEVKVAHNALKLHNPYLTMFDGGFWRLSQEAEEEWEEFKQETLEKGILCVGVIEDAGSYDMHSHEEIKDMFKYFMTDTDILYGVLEVGEVFIINDLYRNMFKRAFARFSKDPMPIACDFLYEQKDSMIEVLNIVYNLTPLEGRGFPLWIDVVDKEVKLTKETTDLLIDNYLNLGYREKYFTGKRNRR